MADIVRGVTALLSDGSLVDADIALAGGVITEVTPARTNGACVLALPGIVDLHGDAFERQIMPRPGVMFPVAAAIAETDRQLAINGITTAFHAVTASWEPGLRSHAMLRALVVGLAEARPRLHVDNRLHLRFETYNLDGVSEAVALIEAGAVDFVAFNDHLPGIREKAADPVRVAEYARRSGTSADEYRNALEALFARRGEVGRAVAAVAAAARARGLPMASHDDRSPEDRRRYAALGCRICEFPLSAEAVRQACADDAAIVMGAPNVVRGGSHTGGMSARDHAVQGTCTVLASDYYYPAPMIAAFALAQSGELALGEAWNMISRNPARTAGVADRGEIAPGRRADLVLVDMADPVQPRLLATLAAGRRVYQREEAVPHFATAARAA
jgi:alpha-D-ribose 1-methylphosphonate 5-triphosphate diphosphatase